MKILHLSDTHAGHFWKYPVDSDIDVICHTGDLLPDAHYPQNYPEVQTAWLKKYAAEINAWAGSVPFLYVQGNHDFIHLNNFVNAVRLTDVPLNLYGEQWCGMAEIPYINGSWNNEADRFEMAAAVDKVMSANGTMLLCHTPPASILAEQWGCNSLTSQLMYRSHRYKACLFGHVHLTQYQQLTINSCLFSNAAIHTEDGAVNLKGFEVIIA